VEFSIFVNIAITLGFLAFTALCIYLIFTISKLRVSFIKLEEDLSELNRNAIPIMENLKIVSDKIKNISENVDDQISILHSSVESIRGMTQNIVSFEKKIQYGVEGPVMEAVSFVSALVKAVQAFVAKMKE
jgi:uncharacterized protein YoxC